MSARENMLGRIRTLLHRQPGDGAEDMVRAYLAAHALSPRPPMAGDPLAQFREKALSLSTTLAEVNGIDEAPPAVAAYLARNGLPTQAVCWPALAGLNWSQHGVSVEARAARESDKVGITGAFCAIAETGTLMTLSGRDTPPSVSLLPETHIAVLRTSQIVPAMEEAWQRLRATADYPPRAVNFISGPSRTADIEQTLTFGAHGPYRVHIVLVRE